jgi:hypothetical protein
MGDKQALATIDCLLVYRIYDNGYSPREVWYYNKRLDLDKHPIPRDRDEIPSFIKDPVLRFFTEAIADEEKRKNWSRNFSVSERLIAEWVLAGHVTPFNLKYYNVGYDNSVQKPTHPTVNRIASFFVYDRHDQKKALLSGYLDYPDPVTRKRIEDFFGFNKSGSPKKEWDSWVNRSFSTVYAIDPLLRIRLGSDSYVVLHTSAELVPYTEGFIVGGIPFGAEKQTLALCDVTDDRAWAKTLGDHHRVFSRWNLVCQTKKLKRVFIEGEPGAGKELWYKAIKGGVEGRIKGTWETLSAVLPDSELIKLLCGQREGNLERSGYLKTCDQGGIFLDEIGKSSATFRSLLLRILESKEYVPDGGTPAKFDDILFVFASTPKDIVDAYDPPDFWTRMDIQLKLPQPIKLGLSSAPKLQTKDRARLYSLFATFWFSDLKSIAICTQNGEITDARKEREEFSNDVFDPLIQAIDKFQPKKDMLKGLPKDLGTIPVSPRRVGNLAASLVNKYRWVGSALKSRDAQSQEARRSWSDLLTALVEGFMEQVISDEKNRRAAEKTKKQFTASHPV